MAIFNLSEKKDNEKYDIVAENGLKIKYLSGRTKYVLTGKIGKECEVSYKTNDAGIKFMIIRVDTGIIDDEIYERSQEQALTITRDDVSDITITEGFLKETIVSFIVDDKAKFYCSGVDYIAEKEGKSRRYSCGKNILVTKRVFERLLSEMGFFDFFKYIPLEKPIEIPLALDKFLMEKPDEFSKTRVFFKNASWFFVNGYLIRTGNKLFIQPFVLQNIDEVSRNTSRVCVRNWVMNQLGAG